MTRVTDITNETTMKAINESRNHGKLKGYDSGDELLFDCLKLQALYGLLVYFRRVANKTVGL